MFYQNFWRKSCIKLALGEELLKSFPWKSEYKMALEANHQRGLLLSKYYCSFKVIGLRNSIILSKNNILGNMIGSF